MECGDHFAGDHFTGRQLRVVKEVRDLSVVQVNVVVLDFFHTATSLRHANSPKSSCAALS
jgi:hypothetical protein